MPKNHYLAVHPAGYSGKPLAQKLGLKRGFKIALADPPPNYWALVGVPPQDVLVQGGDDGAADFVHIFAVQRQDLEGRLEELRARIAPKGMIWVSWPKKASKVPTDLDENVVRELALSVGLVDVKVCAVDETWSGLKLVIPVKSRKQGASEHP